MLDLDKILNNSIEVKLDGQVLEIKEPSHNLHKELTKLFTETKQDKRYDMEITLLKKALDRNNNDRIFSIEELKEFPERVIGMLLVEVFKLSQSSENDPN